MTEHDLLDRIIQRIFAASIGGRLKRLSIAEIEAYAHEAVTVFVQIAGEEEARRNSIDRALSEMNGMTCPAHTRTPADI